MVRTRGMIKRGEMEATQSAPEMNATRSAPPTIEGSVSVAHLPVGFSALPMPQQTSEQASSTVTHKRKESTSSKRSSVILMRKKQLELKAAEARAAIQFDLIQKKLEVDIAEAEAEASERGSLSSTLSAIPDIPDEKVSHVEEWLDSTAYKSVNVPTSKRIQPHIDIGNLNKKLDHVLAATSRHDGVFTRLATKNLLPQFSGDSLDWLHFKDAYMESSSLCHFTDMENISRLRQALSGEAKDAVSALLMSNTSANEVLETLELRFGRAELVIGKLVAKLKKLPTLDSAYQTQLPDFAVCVKNCVAAARKLNQSDYLCSPELCNAVLKKLCPNLLSKWSDHYYEHQKTVCKPRLEMISDFLYSEAIRAATAGVSTLNISETKRDSKKYSVLINHKSEESCCSFCQVPNHDVTDCRKFKRTMRRDKWRFVKRSGLCFLCLLEKHTSNKCNAPKCDVNNCNQPHHKLLHFDMRSQNKNDSKIQQSCDTDLSVSQVSTSKQCTDEIIGHTIGGYAKSEIVLKVIRVTLLGPKGSISCYALLDDGSTVTLIDSGIADRIGLTGERETLRMRGAWNSGEMTTVSERVEFVISGRSGSRFEVRGRKINELNLPVQSLSSFDCNKYKHLSNMSEHIDFGANVKPLILIGQDNFHIMIPLEIITGKLNEPCATRTPLGWTVHGHTGAQSQVHSYFHTMHIDVTNSISEGDIESNQIGKKICLNEFENEYSLNELNLAVKQYFSIDSIGISKLARQNSNNKRALEIMQHTSSRVDDRWEVGLPWKSNEIILPESYANAVSRLKTLERKFAKDAEYAERYKNQMSTLFEKGYARPVNELELQCVDKSSVWYLPHFSVINRNKPEKIRIVFDAAAKSAGSSLNDFLLTGPDLLVPILGILFRFRENAIALTSDIQEMFLQVKIKYPDLHAQRFLWRDNPAELMTHCVMSSLIFGSCCSPFVAQYVKNINAKEAEDRYPTAARAIIEDCYMDDFVHSVKEVSTAIRVAQQVTEIFAQGGFNIRHWNSNDMHVLRSLPSNALGPCAVKLKNGENSADRTLGLVWYPQEDSFAFHVKLKRDPSVCPTKREMLSVLMSVYDVIGFLEPLIVKGKILLQQVWRSKIDWDDQLQPTEYDKWQKWLLELQAIPQLRISRYYLLPTKDTDEFTVNTQLHVFSDASQQAYATVAYWRIVTNRDRVIVVFVAGKSRVSSLKLVSIPRLELQGALLACRLAASIEQHHRYKVDRRVFWNDSTTVLSWIRARNTEKKFKAFEEHRLAEIEEVTDSREWRYIPTNMNVADDATRDSSPPLIGECRWLKGPEFLYFPEESWPQELKQKKDVDTCANTCATQSDELSKLPVPDAHRFSTWIRLLRATTAVLVFVNRCKRRTGAFDNETAERAERLLIISAQRETFSAEISALMHHKQINSNSRLYNLSPYIDEHGLLRVGGRIDRVKNVEFDVKHPVILDGKHYISFLLIKSFHERAFHTSPEMVINELRQRYWIVNLRPSVRSVVARCVTCRQLRAKPLQPRMGELPLARLDYGVRAFTHCGVDLFGPIDVTVCRRHEKRYGVLFTCMTIRAVHIEIVHSLTTDSFIMALRRMAARRGYPRKLYSDNATNFKGSKLELRKALSELGSEELQRQIQAYGMEWTFNCPANPHAGGAWERLIGSTKRALYAVLKERAPKDETLHTLLLEVEHSVNSRPLTHVSSDSRDPEALTPNHFLMGTSSGLPLTGIHKKIDLCSHKQWRTAQALADMFWHRWLKEWLPTLVRRSKWAKEQRNFKVGDLVLLTDPNTPRNIWLKGIVESIHPGKDGRVRIVEVRTKAGILRRPAARMVLLLPVDSACSGTRGENVGDT